MQYTKLPHSSLEISKICLGTMTFGEQNSQADAFQQLDYALERGVNFIDTAEMYPVPPTAQTQGKTEEFIGNWLAKSGKREKIVLATKVAGPRNVPYIRDKMALDHRNIHQAVDDSYVVCKRIISTCINFTGRSAKPILSVSSTTLIQTSKKK